MKNFKSFNLVVLLTCISLFSLSCSSDDDSSNDQSDIFFNFKIDGEQVNISGDEDVYVSNSLVKAINGDDFANQRFITLRTPLDVTTGTYEITGNFNDDFTASFLMNDFSTSNESGTITITEVNDNIISGTFSFTATLDGEEINITEGEFSAFNI